MVMKNVDLDVVMMLHEDQSKKSNSYIYDCKNKCINSVESMQTSITQFQKFFPKGRPEKLGGIVFTNVLVVHNEDIEEIVEDLKIGLERCNGKIGKQRIQRHEVVKIGHIMQLLTKVDISEWQEYLLKELTQKLGTKAMFVLIAIKINDRNTFKDSSKMT